MSAAKPRQPVKRAPPSAAPSWRRARIKEPPRRRQSHRIIIIIGPHIPIPANVPPSHCTATAQCRAGRLEATCAQPDMCHLGAARLRNVRSVEVAMSGSKGCALPLLPYDDANDPQRDTYGRSLYCLTTAGAAARQVCKSSPRTRQSVAFERRRTENFN